MGCCSRCFNSNKNGEKDDEKKNIQNESMSDHEQNELTDNENDIDNQLENPYTFGNDSTSNEGFPNPFGAILQKDWNENSILKAVLFTLSCIPEFKEYFLQKNKKYREISKEVHIYLEYLNKSLDDDNKVEKQYDLNKFKNLLIKKNFPLDKNQSIISIIIKLLLEKLHYENNDPSNSYSDFFTKYLANNNSIISKLFGCLTQISNVCGNCSKNEINYEGRYFVEFPVDDVLKKFPPDKNSKKINLYNCFEYRHNPKLLSGSYCKNCGEYQYKKKEFFYNLPENLIINLNWEKEKGYLGKVTINEKLDLSDYVMNKSLITLMKLNAVICCDEPEHFVAFCKNVKTNKWYCYDKNKVTECTEPEPYKKSKAYVLFYHGLKKEEIQIIDNEFE